MPIVNCSSYYRAPKKGREWCYGKLRAHRQARIDGARVWVLRCDKCGRECVLDAWDKERPAPKPGRKGRRPWYAK